MATAIDISIALLARRQHGHIARWQLLELGLTDDAIAYRLRIGRLHRVYPGVYAVGHLRPDPRDRAHAAVLACGPGAVLSHSSAAALWGFAKQWVEPFEVAVEAHRRPKQIVTHRLRAMVAADKTVQEGIPVTTPARTVLDHVPSVPDRRLQRFLNDALNSLFLTEGALAEVLERNSLHPATKSLSRFVTETPGRTRSPLEDLFVDFIIRFGLPMPELNFPINGRVLDGYYRDEGLIIELDGHDSHRHRTTFELDREKDAEALAAGLSTVRITEQRLEHAPEHEAARLRAILAARQGQAA